MFATSINTKRIFVTGGTGFVGSYIIWELVKKGFSVRALRRSTKEPFWIPAEVFSKIEWVEGDILDIITLEELLDGIDIVIHCAAMVTFDRKGRDEMYQVNVDGTANVVNSCLEKKISRLVYISSVASIGRTTEGGWVDEEKKWSDSKANTHYAKSKFKAELEVWRGSAEGLDVVVLNPSTVLGYGDWNESSNAIFKTISKGFDWYTTGINGFVAVEDVARVAVILMESDIHNERFIVSGDNWSFRKLQEYIATCFKKKGPTKSASKFLMGIAWRIEKLKSLLTGKKAFLTKETARISFSKTQFDNKKLLAALPGFEFTSLETAISNACQAYEAELARSSH